MTKDQVIEKVRQRAERTRCLGVRGLIGSVSVGILVLIIVLVSAFFGLAGVPSEHAATASAVLWIPILTTSLTKIGSILIAIYVIQILINFTKYNFRVADHLEAVADAMDFFLADERLLNTMLEAISPKHITFGKEPNAPMQEVISLLRETLAIAKDKAK